MFKAESTSGDAQVPWDAIRSAADTLLWKCLEGDEAPGSGGQVVYTGGPGPSAGYGWPSNLLVTMGKAGIVGQTGNTTTGAGYLALPVGNGSQIGPHVVISDPDSTAR